MITHLCQIPPPPFFPFCYAFERTDTSKKTHFFSSSSVLYVSCTKSVNDSKCEDSNDGAFVV